MGGAGVCLLGCGNAPFAPHLWIPAFAGMTLRGVGDAAMVRGGVSPPCDRSYPSRASGRASISLSTNGRSPPLPTQPLQACA